VEAVAVNHLEILKRAWRMLWSYKALWVFGFLVALTTCSGGGSGSGGSGGNGGSGASSWLPPAPAQIRTAFGDGLPATRTALTIWAQSLWAAVGNGATRGARLGRLPAIDPWQISVLVAGFLALILLGVALATLVRYVATTAMIRMVALREQDGRRRSVREGFGLGWSVAAWRLFLSDVVVIGPLVAVFLGMFAFALAPLLLLLADREALAALGVGLTLVLSVGLIGLGVLTALAVSLYQPLYWRGCGIDGLGVVESLRQGLALLRRRLWDVGLMWLLLLILGIGFGLATFLSFFLLLPLTIGLGVAAGSLTAVPALLVAAVSTLVLGTAVPAIPLAILALIVTVLAASVPMIFLVGLLEVFRSSAWTLSYRELRTAEVTVPGL
jgi:hypothetical protein